MFSRPHSTDNNKMKPQQFIFVTQWAASALKLCQLTLVLLAFVYKNAESSRLSSGCPCESKQHGPKPSRHGPTAEKLLVIQQSLLRIIATGRAGRGQLWRDMALKGSLLLLPRQRNEGPCPHTQKPQSYREFKYIHTRMQPNTLQFLSRPDVPITVP